MIEKHIILEDIDPVMFYGVGNGNLQMIKSLYPKLRIVARDNVIRVLGDEEEMAKAEEDIELMRKHLAKYNMLNEEDILDIVKGKQTKADSVKGVLVYSISGRPIKSRSENQQQLIEAYEKNDMIFAVVCEELGIVGAAGLIIAFLVMFWRITWIAIKATDLFGTMICVGVLIQLAIQVVINVAVVTNSIPSTGIPLPLISYGGTSATIMMAEMGLVLSVSAGSK